MKIANWFLPGLFVAFISCKDQQQASIPPPPFLPGIYVSELQNEFCRITDTLIIQRLDLAGTAYRISRRSAFQRINRGLKRPSECQSDQWRTSFDPTRNVLFPVGDEAEIAYSPEKNKVYKGDWEYEKVE